MYEFHTLLLSVLIFTFPFSQYGIINFNLKKLRWYDGAIYRIGNVTAIAADATA